jgi:transposase-like protein
MNLLQLTSADLKGIAGLLKEKEALLARIARIDSRLMAYVGGGAPVAAPARAKAAGKAAAKPAFRARRPGKLKAKVIALLQGAGKGGISVREIAAKLGLNPQRIYVWFNSTGKGIREVKKVAPATYTWNA